MRNLMTTIFVSWLVLEAINIEKYKKTPNKKIIMTYRD
jgi:hypothetical protein